MIYASKTKVGILLLFKPTQFLIFKFISSPPDLFAFIVFANKIKFFRVDLCSEFATE